MQRVALLSVEQAVAAGETFGLHPARATRSVFRTLAHSPDLAKAVYGLVAVLLDRNQLSTRLRELMIMRIGWVTQSNYEWTQHWRMATKAGVPEEDLLAVRDWQNSDRLTGADKAVLAAVDDTLRDGKISDEVWVRCASFIGEPAKLIEMVLVIGNWTMFSQLLRSLEVPLEEGTPSWPPDGATPPSGGSAGSCS